MMKTLLFGLLMLVGIEAVEYGSKINAYQAIVPPSPSSVVVPKNPIQTYVSNKANKLSSQQIQQQLQQQQQQHQQQQISSPPSALLAPAYPPTVFQAAPGFLDAKLYPSVSAAVQSKRFVDLISYPNQYDQVQPQVVEVDAITAPVQFVFRSASGPLLFQQVHIPSLHQEPQHTRSEEPAQLLTHEVFKPIVQELREVIQPYRHVTQEIKPVLEEVRTIVAQSEKSQGVVEEVTGGVELKQSNVQPTLTSLQTQSVKSDLKTASNVDYA